MKAVIYARYSSDSQREESIEGQIRECTAFAEKHGITLDDVKEATQKADTGSDLDCRGAPKTGYPIRDNPFSFEKDKSRNPPNLRIPRLGGYANGMTSDTG